MSSTFNLTKKSPEFKDLKQCLSDAKKCIDNMLEDATRNDEDAMQSFMESAEDAQAKIMRAIYVAVMATTQRN